MRLALSADGCEATLSSAVLVQNGARCANDGVMCSHVTVFSRARRAPRSWRSAIPNASPDHPVRYARRHPIAATQTHSKPRFNLHCLLILQGVVQAVPLIAVLAARRGEFQNHLTYRVSQSWRDQSVGCQLRVDRRHPNLLPNEHSVSKAGCHDSLRHQGTPSVRGPGHPEMPVRTEA